ncbi:protein-tyrosine phosphatase-like protein [Syncephalis plumigaleata]|nr:protein-tyrosine phosphatase-like protein [Syncephalis plumigaleata]
MVFSREFEGTFPSRILPHLLLGDIATANNVGLLKALGVTHVLSIGIRPNHTDSSMVFKFVDNIEDDGYGDLLNNFHECNTFIDEANACNGRVFVHCQVGTSRSATITIAYIIKYLVYRCSMRTFS